MNFFKLLAATAAMTSWLSCSSEKHGVFIEAEGMDTHGGWVLDNQSMMQMGSPYLMAHGMGVPVEAAHGSLRFSLDIDNDEEQIDYIIEKVHSVVERYRSMSPYWEDLEKGVREHCIPE